MNIPAAFFEACGCKLASNEHYIYLLYNMKISMVHGAVNVKHLSTHIDNFCEPGSFQTKTTTLDLIWPAYSLVCTVAVHMTQTSRVHHDTLHLRITWGLPHLTDLLRSVACVLRRLGSTGLRTQQTGCTEHEDRNVEDLTSLQTNMDCEIGP